MNTILNHVNSVEATAPVKQTQKTKGASTNEFRDMLSGAISSEKPQAPRKEAAGNQVKTAETGKPSNETQATVKPETQEKPADKEVTDEAGLAAAMQANLAGNAIQPEAEIDPEAESTDFLKLEAAQLSSVKLQAMTQQAATAQTTSVQVESVDTAVSQANSAGTATAQANPADTVPAQANSVDTASAQADSVNKATVQTNPAGTAPAQESTVQTAAVATETQAPEAQTTVQPGIRQQVEAPVPEKQVTTEAQTAQPQENAQQTGSAAEQVVKSAQDAKGGEVNKPSKAAETVQVTSRQAEQPENHTKAHEKPVEARIEKPENQAQTAKPENQEKTVQVSANTEQAAGTAEQPKDAPRTRFDDMIAKASKELSQGEEVKTEEAGYEKPPVSAEKPETPETAAGTAKQEIPLKTAEKQEAKTDTAPATVVKSEPAAPKSMQRSVREIPGTDEATIGLVHPKQEIFTPETVKIQAEPAPAQPFRAPDQAEQIKAEVIRNIEENKMEFNMQLNPKELGKIDVKMVLQGGSLSVEIIAANAQATELLAKQAESLVATLKAGNIEISSVSVVHEAQNASGNMDGQFNLNNFQSRGNAHEQHGHAGRSGNGENGGNGGNGAENEITAAETEAGSAPKGKLNYSI